MFNLLNKIIIILCILCIPLSSLGATFFTESFDDTSLSSRGWFDNLSMAVDTSTKYSGAGSAKFTWAAAATKPTTTGTWRHDISSGGTEKLYVSFYWRFNADWVGSGVAYHPHIIYILSNLDTPIGGLAGNYLDTYIETGAPAGLQPKIGLQDALNTNVSYGTPPIDITALTEDRSVNHCNGCMAGQDCGNVLTCYWDGTRYYSARTWQGTSNFVLSTWHHVETYLQMNTIVGGVAQPNGIIKMWRDGVCVVNKSNIIYRTGYSTHATMTWKTLVIAPHIGVGSPQIQTMWMDDLVVGDTDPSLPNLPPAPPQNLRIE